MLFYKKVILFFLLRASLESQNLEEYVETRRRCIFILRGETDSSAT